MKSILSFFSLLLITLSGCSYKTFMVSTDPEGSLVRFGNSLYCVNVGETGNSAVNHQVSFVGKNDSSYFLGMKRGYNTDSVWVGKYSDPNIKIILKKNGQSEVVSDYSNLLSVNELIVLPVYVDALFHKGVGNVGKYEKSPEESSIISLDLSNRLATETTFPASHSKFISGRLINSGDSLKIPDSLKDYLLGLDPALLRYYSIAPSISKFFAVEHKNLLPDNGTFEGDKFLACIYCKTIKPTGGRIAGNIIVGTLAAANPTSPVYNPSAFNLDNSSLITIYYIHYPSGEVIKTVQQSLPYDTVNEKGRDLAYKVLLEMLKTR